MLNVFSETGSLVDKRGRIMIPGIYDSVAPVTEEEQSLYEKIDFDLDEYCQDVGVKKLLHSTKVRRQLSDKTTNLTWDWLRINLSHFLLQEEILMHRWRHPSLSLHGIEGAFAEAGAKTVIPRKVIGKFSIRLVPDMDPKVVEKQVMLKEIKIVLEIGRNTCAQTICGTVFKKCKSLVEILFLRRLHAPCPGYGSPAEDIWWYGKPK